MSGMEDARRWIASWTTLAWVLAVWVLMVIVRPATYGHVAWDWLTLILLWLLSLALVAWVVLRVVLYVSEKRRLRSEGVPVLTHRTIRSFLLVGWVIALIFRLTTVGGGSGVLNLVTFVLFWTFTVALIAFFIWTRLQRRRQT
jgi:hypothetical protein